MQLLHKREDYAFLFMRELALDPASYTSVHNFSERHHISKATLKSCARSLQKAGLIRAREGNGGGYQLAKAPETITVQDIISCFDGPVAMSACESADHTCRLGMAHCAFKQNWSSVSHHVNALLAEKTLAELVNA